MALKTDFPFTDHYEEPMDRTGLLVDQPYGAPYDGTTAIAEEAHLLIDFYVNDPTPANLECLEKVIRRFRQYLPDPEG